MIRSSRLARPRALACTLLALTLAPHAFATRTQDDAAALAQKLTDPSDEVRRVAVADLAQLNTPATWTLVVGALADPSARVADEAQVRLADIVDPAAQKSLWSKSGTGSKDMLVQQRAIEAIGRLQVEVDGVLVAKLLSSREADVRCTAARALERLAKADQLEKKSQGYAVQQLDSVIKGDKDAAVRAAAIAARQALAEYTVSDLFGMLSKRGAGVVRGSAACALAEVEFGQVVRLIDDTLEDEEPCTVRVFAELLRERGQINSAHSLVAILGRYPNPRLQWTIVDCLRDWSGIPQGPDLEQWRRWADALPDDWEAPARPAGVVERFYSDNAVLLGQPVVSDRLAIVVDVSDWIAAARADGTPRKAWVRGEIERLLGTLPERSEFNLIVYADGAAACEKSLVPVKPDSIKRALKWFDAGKWNGKGDFLGAAELALDDPRVDTILVVTPNAPAGARHVDMGLLLERVLLRNRFQRVVIDAVLVEPDSEAEEGWQSLVGPFGGRVTKAGI
jgi:hypothetical protein